MSITAWVKKKLEVFGSSRFMKELVTFPRLIGLSSSLAAFACGILQAFGGVSVEHQSVPGQVLFLIIACLGLLSGLVSYVYVLVIFYNDDMDDDDNVTLFDTYDFYFSMLFNIALFQMAVWLWSDKTAWSGVLTERLSQKTNTFRIFLDFVFYTLSMYGNVGGATFIAPVSWYAQALVIIVFAMNITIIVAVLSTSASLAIDRIKKRVRSQKHARVGSVPSRSSSSSSLSFHSSQRKPKTNSDGKTRGKLRRLSVHVSSNKC